MQSAEVNDNLADCKTLVKGGRGFLERKPGKELLKWVLLDIVPAIPCATLYRNCKTPEIVDRVRRDPTLLTVAGFQVRDFVFSEFCNRLKR